MRSQNPYMKKCTDKRGSVHDEMRVNSKPELSQCNLVTTFYFCLPNIKSILRSY